MDKEPVVACSSSPVLRRRLSYVDGKPRPYYRGLLHGILTIAIVVASVYLLAALLIGSAPTQWWRVLVLLIGKGFSYGASAALHLLPFRSKRAATLALKLDLAAIPVATWAGCVLFASEPRDWLVESLIGGVCTIVNGLCVNYQFEGHVGLDTPKARSDAPRSVAISLHFAWFATRIGGCVGYGSGWLAGVIVYLVAFGVAIPVTAAHAKEPISRAVPWHRPGLNGLHEDFHVLLLLGDWILFRQAMSLLPALAG